MKCSKCGQECADGARFCTNCGAELTISEPAEEVVKEAAEAVSEVGEENPEAQTSAESKEATTEVAVVDEVIKADDVEVEDNTNKPAKTKEEKRAEKLAKKKYTDADKKPNGRRKAGIALAAAAVLLFIIIGLCFGGEEYTAFSDKSVFAIVNDNDTLVARFMDGKTLKLDESSISYDVYSMDRTVAAYINSDGELDIIKNGKVIKTGIDDAKNVKVSNYGDTLIYYSDTEYAAYYNARYEYEDSTLVGTLHLYYIKKGKDIEVAEEVVVGSAVLSPNGETVAYVSDYDASDDFRGYYSVKGKKTGEIGKEKRAFAIADKAAYIYYADDDRIYAQKKKKEAEKLASDLHGIEVLLNADCTEMIFMNDDKAYVTVKAGEKKKIASDELNSIILEDTAAVCSDSIRAEQGTIEVVYTGVESLKENLFYSDRNDEIFYVMDDFEAERIASDARQYAVAEDGESLVYIDGMEIVRVTKFDKGGSKEEISDDAEARYLLADGELKYIYYVNWDGELHCIKGKKDKKIADDVTSYEISADGKICYYVVEEEKYCYSKKARKGKTLLSEDDSKVNCERDKGFVITGVTGEDMVDVYLMDGKKMKKLYSYENTVGSYLEDLFEYGDLYDSIFNY